jgi:hypothetical protein
MSRTVKHFNAKKGETLKAQGAHRAPSEKNRTKKSRSSFSISYLTKKLSDLKEVEATSE